VEKKKKKIVGQVEEPEIQSENMEPEPDLDNVFRYLDHPTDAIQHNQALRNLSIDFKDLEYELFNIKIRNEFNVAPMRSYIEEWLES
jgi:hypothetical protein